MKRFLPLLFFGAWMFAQGKPNCSQALTLTGATAGAAISSTAGASQGCAGWRLTWQVAGSISAATIQLEGSQNNSSWHAFTGALIIEGSNPAVWTPATMSNTIVVLAYLPYVRVHVTSVTGSGTIKTLILGYSGTSAGSGGGSPTPPTADTPSFSPGTGSYSGTQAVTISTATSGCGSYIYWSTTDNPPTTGDTQGTSVSVSVTETVYAKVIGCPGYLDSAVGSAAYTISAGGSLTFVSAQHGDTIGGTTLATTVSGTNPLLIVNVSLSSPGTTAVTGVAWSLGGGTPVQAGAYPSGGSWSLYTYCIPAPTVGSGTITTTLTGGGHAYTDVQLWTGANQTSSVCPSGDTVSATNSGTGLTTIPLTPGNLVTGDATMGNSGTAAQDTTAMSPNSITSYHSAADLDTGYNTGTSGITANCTATTGCGALAIHVVAH